MNQEDLDLIIGYAMSAILTGRDNLSSLPWIIAASMPMSLRVLSILRAISPRLAINTRFESHILIQTEPIYDESG